MGLLLRFGVFKTLFRVLSPIERDRDYNAKFIYNLSFSNPSGCQIVVQIGCEIYSPFGNVNLLIVIYITTCKPSGNGDQMRYNRYPPIHLVMGAV